MKKSGSNGQPPDDTPSKTYKKHLDTSNFPDDWEEYVDDNPAEDIPPPEKPKPQKVGRGNPPKHSQFKPGQSGNPGGRPKGAKNMRTLIWELAEEQVNITTNDGQAKVTIREAAARKFLAMMMKGDFRYYKEFWGIEEIEGKRLSDEYRRHSEEQVQILQMLISGMCEGVTDGYRLVKVTDED